MTTETVETPVAELKPLPVVHEVRHLFRPGTSFKLLLAIENDDNARAAIRVTDALIARGAVPSVIHATELWTAAGVNDLWRSFASSSPRAPSSWACAIFFVDHHPPVLKLASYPWGIVRSHIESRKSVTCPLLAWAPPLISRSSLSRGAERLESFTRDAPISGRTASRRPECCSEPRISRSWVSITNPRRGRERTPGSWMPDVRRARCRQRAPRSPWTRRYAESRLVLFRRVREAGELASPCTPRPGRSGWYSPRVSSPFSMMVVAKKVDVSRREPSIPSRALLLIA